DTSGHAAGTSDTQSPEDHRKCITWPPCKRQTRGRRSFEPHLQRASTVHRTGGSPVSQITSHCNPVGYTSCWTRLVAPNCGESERSRPEILDHLSSSAMPFAFWLDWASQRLNADCPPFPANTAWPVGGITLRS